MPVPLLTPPPHHAFMHYSRRSPIQSCLPMALRHQPRNWLKLKLFPSDRLGGVPSCRGRWGAGSSVDHSPPSTGVSHASPSLLPRLDPPFRTVSCHLPAVIPAGTMTDTPNVAFDVLATRIRTIQYDIRPGYDNAKAAVSSSSRHVRESFTKGLGKRAGATTEPAA